jgi:hypothetical protein
LWACLICSVTFAIGAGLSQLVNPISFASPVAVADWTGKTAPNP